MSAAPKRIDLPMTNPKQVALSFVAGKYRVSTVRLNSLAVAMDSIFGAFGVGHGPTSTDTFETMVFAATSAEAEPNWTDLDCERTTDLEQAKRNHEAVCAKWEVA